MTKGGVAMKRVIIALLLMTVMSTAMAFPVMNTINNNETEDQNAMNNVSSISTEIGDRIHEITGKTVEEIRREIKQQGGNRNVSEIAKRIGVSVKAVVLTKVQEIRERIREEMKNAKEVREEVRGEMREAHTYRYEYAFEKWSLYMNKTIERLDALGANTTGLIALKDEFYDKYVELQNTTTPREVLAELKDTIREFRRTASGLAEDFETIEQEVNDEVKQNITSIRQSTWVHLKEVALNVFDIKVAAAEHKLDVIESNGISVSDLRTMLDDIKAMRSDLEAAYDSMNRTQVLQVNQEIITKWIEFRKAFSEAVRSTITERIALKINKFALRIEKRAQKCGEAIDLTEIKKMADELKQNASKAPELRKAIREKKQEIISILRCRMTR